VAQDGAKVTEGRVWVNPSAAKQFGGAEIVPVDRQPGAGDGFAGVARACFCVLIFSMSAARRGGIAGAELRKLASFGQRNAAVRAENQNPDVSVMRHDASDLLNRARDRRILVQ
jgi:hypothetical protein